MRAKAKPSWVRTRYVIHQATSSQISEVVAAPRSTVEIARDIIEKRKKTARRSAKRPGA